MGSFPACWRLADVVPVPMESSSSDVGDYISISITSLLSHVFEKIVAGKLSNFLKSISLLPPCFRIGGAWKYAMLCLHCLSIYKLLWTGVWKEGLFS